MILRIHFRRMACAFVAAVFTVILLMPLTAPTVVASTNTPLLFPLLRFAAAQPNLEPGRSVEFFWIVRRFHKNSFSSAMLEL